MPRYRKLHTKTIESLDLNDMPDDFTRLFWVLLPLALCREGRGLDNGAWLKSRLFPLREDITQDTVYQAFRWCCGRGMIERYAVDGRGYFYVPTFHKYQGNTIKEAESDYPPPPVQSESASDPAEVQTNSGATPELVQSKSGTDAIFNMQYSDADAERDAAPIGAPAPAPDNGRDTSPTPHQAMFGALCTVYKWDTQLLTEKQRGRLNSEAKRLLLADKTPRDVWAAGEWWWENDWRGKKGSTPTYSQLVETLGKVETAPTGPAELGVYQ